MFAFVRRVSSNLTWLSAAAAFCAFSCLGNAQTQEFSLGQVSPAAAVPPYALFQYATLGESGDNLTATFVPVVTSTGAIVYKDVALQFVADVNGNLTLAAGFPKVTPSLSFITSGFKAGRYVGPSTSYSGNMIVNVSGPSVTSGGATEWTLATATGANQCTYPATATWYVGPLANSPIAARVKAAGITSTAWYFGVGSGECSYPWYTNILIGVSQVGNTLMIATFTYGGTDYSLPKDQVTYTLAP